MEITNDEIEVMIIWILKKMKFDMYYPVKSEKATELLKQIIREEIFQGLNLLKIIQKSGMLVWLRSV